MRSVFSLFSLPLILLFGILIPFKARGGDSPFQASTLALLRIVVQTQASPVFSVRRENPQTHHPKMWRRFRAFPHITAPI